MVGVMEVLAPPAAGLAEVGRVDGYAKVTGQAAYTADLVFPDMLHGAVVRSPYPHARIVAIHAGKALALPGVHAVLTGADIPYGTFGRGICDIPALARGEVRYVGERVAAVAAASPALAAAAAALIEVEYEPLPALLDAEAALAPGAVAVHAEPWRYPKAVVTPADPPNLQNRMVWSGGGEVAAALAASQHVFTHTFRAQARHLGYLEAHACIARVTPDGIEVWATNKGPYFLRNQLAAWMEVAPERIQIHPVPIGGDFGGKGSPADIPVAIALAQRTGRAVQIRSRYAEDLRTANSRHPAVVTVRLGVDAAHRITALAVQALMDGGAYAGYKPFSVFTGSSPVHLRSVSELANAYRIPALHIENNIVYTHTVPKGHHRAPGSVQVVFALESALDMAARALGIDPIQFRLDNLLRTGEAGPLGDHWLEVRAEEVLRAALAAVEEPGANAAAAGLAWAHGTGIALFSHATHGGRTEVALQPQPDGALTVWVPFPDQGAGQFTVAQRVVERCLGLPAAAVAVRQAELAGLTFDSGCSGSRVTVDAAEALSLACRRLRERLQSEAGLADAASPDELRAALARFAHRTGQERVVQGLDHRHMPHVTSYCAQVARVRVDRATGQVEVEDLVTALDVAEIINWNGHMAQIEGGMAMGLGDALLEDLRITDGQPAVGNLGEYRLPTQRDLPPARVVLLGGSRGVGEQNAKSIGELSHVALVPAIANAVADAVGVRIDSLPITAEKVYAALQQAGNGTQR